MVFHTNHPKDFPMKLSLTNQMLLLFGYFITVSIVIAAIQLGQSGGSTTQNRELTQRLLTPPSVEIR